MKNDNLVTFNKNIYMYLNNTFYFFSNVAKINMATTQVLVDKFFVNSISSASFSNFFVSYKKNKHLQLNKRYTVYRYSKLFLFNANALNKSIILFYSVFSNHYSDAVVISYNTYVYV